MRYQVNYSLHSCMLFPWIRIGLVLRASALFQILNCRLGSQALFAWALNPLYLHWMKQCMEMELGICMVRLVFMPQTCPSWMSVFNLMAVLFTHLCHCVLVCESLLLLLCMSLKTLFNIVEAPLKKLVQLWCLCCMMMFRWTNKQPGIQKFWIHAVTIKIPTCMTEYHHWINGQAYHLF